MLTMLIRWSVLCLGLSLSTSSIAAESEAYTKPSKAELRKKLTKEQYYVTQEDGTEQPFKNAYWNNHQDGIYVDVVSGEPLFSSIEKYDSGTGWPSFWQPLVKSNIVEKPDFNLLLGMRTEVRSKMADSHLGHVFKDGPAPTGLRYCMNSAALKFIPAAELTEKGYGEWAYLFKKIAAGDKEGAAPVAPALQANNDALSATPIIENIVFAGGCFWGVQAVFKHVKGVTSSISGYAGGSVKNPSYEQVSQGTTGHAESVKVTYDSSQVTLSTLLKVFFEVAHDPTELNRQGPDVGTNIARPYFIQIISRSKLLILISTR